MRIGREMGMKPARRKVGKGEDKWLKVYLEKTGCWLCVGGAAATVLQAGHLAHDQRGSRGRRQSHEGSGQQVRPHLNDLHQKVLGGQGVVGSDESERDIQEETAPGEVAGQAVAHINSRVQKPPLVRPEETTEI